MFRESNLEKQCQRVESAIDHSLEAFFHVIKRDLEAHVQGAIEMTSVGKAMIDAARKGDWMLSERNPLSYRWWPRA